MPCAVSAPLWLVDSFSPPLTPQEGIPSYPLILKIRLKKHSYFLPLLWAASKTKQKNKQKQGGFFCLDPTPSNARASQLRGGCPSFHTRKLGPGMSQDTNLLFRAHLTNLIVPPGLQWSMAWGGVGGRCVGGLGLPATS